VALAVGPNDKEEEEQYMFHIQYMMYLLRKKGKNVPVSNVKAVREIKV